MARQAVEMTFPDDLPPAAPGNKAGAPAMPAIQARSLSVLARARGLVITNQDELSVADQFRQDIKALLRSIDDAFDPQIEQAFALHRSLLAKKKEFAGPPLRALEIINPRIAEYMKERDRARLQTERERQIKEQEAKRLAEIAVDKASELVDEGRAAEANAVLKEAALKAGEIEASAPEVPEKPLADVSLRTTWDFEVVDAEKIPRKYLVPDLVTIGKVVRAIKDQTDIPGIRVFPKTSVADRGRKY